MYSGIKAVSLSNQSRIKGVRERPWTGRVPGEKRHSLASSLLPSRSRCGILSCKRLVTSYDGEILKKSLWKIWKRDKVCLIFAPAKTERGARRGDGEFAWRWRSGVVDDDLSRRVTFKRGARKKKFEKTSRKIWRETWKRLIFATAFASKTSDARKERRRVL